MVQLDLGAVMRRTWWSSIEFSISDDADAHSTMVPASAALLDDLGDPLAALPFADRWFVAVQRLMSQVAPDAALFRIDWKGALPVAVTWYVRFTDPPDDAAFERTMLHARPWEWNGPSPGQVAEVLGLGGPRGVALRADRDGSARTALYFRLRQDPGTPATVPFEQIFDTAGLSGEGAAHASADASLLGASGQIEVIGLDDAGDGSAGALKIDVADVPVPIALRLLAARGAGVANRDRVAALATSLRARSLGYLGLKYSAASFDGWRAYFPSEPVRYPAASSIRTSERTTSTGRPRAPHY